MQHLKYDMQKNKAFQLALKKNIKDYFTNTNQHIKGNGMMTFKVIFFIAWMVIGYWLLFSATSFIQTLLGYLVSSTGALLTVITVGHDASHKALSENKYVNKFFSYSWTLLGLSEYLWEAKHHHSHHSFTNIIDYDQDIAQSKLIRMNPRETYCLFHKYQKYYAPLLYIIFGFFAITYREFKLYSVREYGNTYSKHNLRLLFTILLMKVFYFGLNLALPLLLIPIPAWQIVLSFLLTVSVAGLYIVLVLAVPHINRKSVFKNPPKNGVIQTDWYSHALEVTVDSSPSSRFVNWFTGGLNTHIVHHLFPNICHIHYRNLTPIVAKTAQEYGLTYKADSFINLIKDHFLILAEFGESPVK